MKDQTGSAFVAWGTQIFAVLVIAYAFLVPMPTSYAVLFGSFVSLAMMIFEAQDVILRNLMAHYQDKTAKQLLWHARSAEHATDEALLCLRVGHDVKVDWREIADKVAFDMRADVAEERFNDEIDRMGRLNAGMLWVLVIPILMLGRPAVGWGLAKLVEEFAPGFAQLVVPA